MIEQKIEQQDKQQNDGNDNEDYDDSESISFYQMIKRTAECNDYLLLFLGVFGATVFGACTPAYCLFLGNMIDALGQGAAQLATNTLIINISNQSSLNSTYDNQGSSSQTNQFQSLRAQALYQVYIGLIVFVVSWLSVTLLSLFADNISLKTKVKYFEKCLEKDAAFYDQNNPQEISSKIEKEVSVINRGIGERLGNVISAVTSLFFGFIFSFYWGWLLTCILLGALPLLFGFGLALGSLQQSGHKETMKAYSQSAGYAEQALQAIKIVHTYGQELLELKNYSKHLKNAQITSSKQILRGAFGQGALWLNIFLFDAFSLYFGGYLRYKQFNNSDGNLYTSGQIISIMFSIMFSSFNLGGAGPQIRSIAESKVAAKIAYETMDQKADINPLEKGISISNILIQGEIKFENVDFKYPSQPDIEILKNFSCVFEAGKTTALVGSSGSGKSTIIQLIERFYNTQGGSILVDSYPINTINIRELRQIIGYVGQEPVLFNTTIRENMLFSKPDATEEEIIEALKNANAWDFIQNNMTENSLDTLVGSSGGQLSGGQKQRIAIARVFLKKPKILLLDEATSALDKVNEKAVQNSIMQYRKLQGNITVIIIAHRLSTIIDADNILVINKGQIIETGNHQQLISNYPDGIYSNFCKKQETSEIQNQVYDINDQDKTIEQAKLNEIKEENGEMDIENQEKLKEANKKDEIQEENICKIMEEFGKVSGFRKLVKYNEPKIFIFVGIIMSAMSGAAQPLFGMIFSKVVNLLTIPIISLSLIYGYNIDMQDQMNKYCLGTFFLAISLFISNFYQKYSFGKLGENVTMKIRKILYISILQKEIGFHDNRDNGSSVLTSIMSQDTSILNGASTESIGPQVEAFFALFVGLGIGFGFCWQEAIICLFLAPFLTIGQKLHMETQKGLTDGSQDSDKDANLLCGDAILNYKTVQSFGNENQIVKKYKEYLMPAFLKSQIAHIKTGFTFGLTQCCVYFLFSGMFFGGSLLIQYGYNAQTNTYSISSENVFIAMWAIMFGASQAGTASSMGPDIAKAQVSAEKIFKIIEQPSKINAVEMDNNKLLKNTDEVLGHIKFIDVWFRYPQRKEDFVLKGFNIEINPNETVALVGESGCGKSTFVNLLMRFYEIDFGQILLDGVDIKEYNLHQLRQAVSLVMQEPIIFNYSILENVLYGKSDASNKEILQATNIANCDEFIQNQETIKFQITANSLIEEINQFKDTIIQDIGAQKYTHYSEILKKMKNQEDRKEQEKLKLESIDERDENLKDQKLKNGFLLECGVKGSKLSGGQKQRVAIARTIIRKPKVLLLDEATSALDEDSQKKVQLALENVMKDRTVIIIAHRLSTIQQCDKIFVLENGKVKEQGNFNQLQSKGGLFSKLSQNNQS